MWLTIIHWHMLATKSFKYYFTTCVGISFPMQIVHNSIWFGERCKGLSVNEIWVTHILNINMGTSEKALFIP